MGRTVWIVAYDICNDKRLRKVARIMENFGRRIQYSVFECHLDECELIACMTELAAVIKHDEDQVLFLNFGPSSSLAERDIRTVGRPFHKIDPPSYVV